MHLKCQWKLHMKNEEGEGGGCYFAVSDRIVCVFYFFCFTFFLNTIFVCILEHGASHLEDFWLVFQRCFKTQMEERQRPYGAICFHLLLYACTWIRMPALLFQISNLFARDEIDEITSDLISVMKKEHPRRPPTNENLYDYFMSRVRQNLHTVLCFSPVGEKFRNRALKFPALVSGCTIDWFSRWPKDALVAG